MNIISCLDDGFFKTFNYEKLRVHENANFNQPYSAVFGKVILIIEGFSSGPNF